MTSGRGLQQYKKFKNAAMSNVVIVIRAYAHGETLNVLHICYLSCQIHPPVAAVQEPMSQEVQVHVLLLQVLLVLLLHHADVAQCTFVGRDRS